MSRGGAVVLAGSATTLVALLLPWWDSGIGATANGFHDWGWLTFFAMLLAAALLVVRVAGVRLRLAAGDGAVWIATGAAEVLGAVIFLLSGHARLAGAVRTGVFVAVAGGMVTLLGGCVRRAGSS
jgi:hypothetical protein